MSFSKEWTEWHLTPRGWEGGSECIDFAGVTAKDAPADRVLTYRWLEEQTSPYSQMKQKHQLIWESPDKQAIGKLRKKFGAPPSHL